MAVIPIIQQTWDTTSYVNPTRMNNIETNIGILSKATGVEYSTGVSVKEKIDGLAYTGSLDDLKTTGTYGHTVTASSNAPTTVNEGSIVTIQVLNSQQGLVSQVLYYGNMRLYIRRFYNDSWSDWRMVGQPFSATYTDSTNADGAIVSPIGTDVVIVSAIKERSGANSDFASVALAMNANNNGYIFHLFSNNGTPYANKNNVTIRYYYF